MCSSDEKQTKEPRREGRVFLVSGHEATTLNVCQCSGGKHCKKCQILRRNEAELNVFSTVPSQEHLKPFKVVASWLDAKNARPSILGSFALVLVA